MDTPTQNVSTDFFKKKKKTGVVLASVFALAAILLTWALYGYNMTLKNTNSDLISQANQLQTSIDEIRADPQIGVYALYERNKRFLSELEEQSQISSFVTHIKKTLMRYRAEPKGFSYSDGVVETEISTQSEDGTAAYQKLSRFIESYRADEDAMFTLLPLESFSGYDKIIAPATFELK